MNRRGMTRNISVLIGAVVLFGLELGFGVTMYIAIPAGVLAYLASLVAMGLLLGTETPAK
jgi:hypothetical protein